jgi:hypothetical protein
MRRALAFHFQSSGGRRAARIERASNRRDAIAIPAPLQSEPAACPAGHQGGGRWTDDKERDLSKLQIAFAGPAARFLSGLGAAPRSSRPNQPPRQAAPTNFFPLSKCLDICSMGNVTEMEKFCRAYTVEGTPNARRCWKAVVDLQAGNIAKCKNRCRAIAKNW